MSPTMQGIHHISSIVGNPNEVIAFYRNILGLRLVKQTVNYDNPYTYHLYFGNNEADIGTIITFFPWKDYNIGIVGDGQVTITSYAIPKDSLNFWKNRLQQCEIKYTEQVRFGNTTLILSDFHGLRVELVEKDWGKLNTYQADESLTTEFAIQGFAGAVISSHRPEATDHVLVDLFGWKKMRNEGNFTRYMAPGDKNEWIDVRQIIGSYGKFAIGTVHHIAFATQSKEEQEYWQKLISDDGYKISDIRDRGYFNAIYFRERGGTLFEIATLNPGFTVDEPLEHLGETLFIPEIHQDKKNDIYTNLIPLDL